MSRLAGSNFGVQLGQLKKFSTHVFDTLLSKLPFLINLK